VKNARLSVYNIVNLHFNVHIKLTPGYHKKVGCGDFFFFCTVFAVHPSRFRASCMLRKCSTTSATSSALLYFMSKVSVTFPWACLELEMLLLFVYEHSCNNKEWRIFPGKLNGLGFLYNSLTMIRFKPNWFQNEQQQQK
jgi:hypothetical protein